MIPMNTVKCENCIHCRMCGMKSQARDIEGNIKKLIEQAMPPLKDSMFSISLTCDGFSSEIEFREKDGKFTINGVPSQLFGHQNKVADRMPVSPTAFTGLYDIRD